MKHVLVTGIEGFVGGHLARQLSQDGLRVSGLHLADVRESLPAELVRGDVTDYDSLRSLLESLRPDAVIHLAGISSVAAAEHDVNRTFEVNTFGAIRLLEAVRRLDLRCRVLLISSADVYGRSNVGAPLTEDAPCLPQSAYAASKLLACEAGRYYHRAHGLDTVMLRPFSHTGPGQAPVFIFPKVAQAIARIERGRADPVIEMGNLEIRRDYTDVRDICRAYSLALTRCRAGEAYNVTSGRPVLLREAVALLCSLSRQPVQVRSSEAQFRTHDIPVLTGDPSKFVRATGWQPQVPFEQTLSDLLDHYRQQA